MIKIKALSFTAEELCELVVDGLQPRFVVSFVFLKKNIYCKIVETFF